MALSKNAMMGIAVAVIAVIVIIAAVVIVNNNSGDNPYPKEGVTITTFTDYNGNTAEVTFTKVPDRVVCGCNTALNLLLYLGLGDKIVGVYYDEEEVWDEVKEEYDKLVKRIGETDASGAKHLSGNISTDVLLSWQPDLVIGWVSWNENGLGTEKFWNDNGCNVMSFNTMTSNAYRTVQLTKVDYDNVGKIFNIPEKTSAVYSDLIDVLNEITMKMKGKDTLYYALVDGAVNVEKGTVWVYKNTNFIASVLNSMGMTNAFPDGGTVSLAKVYEVIGTTNIDMLFFITYGGVTYEKSLKSWQDDADLSKCDAIKQKHTLEMKLSCSYGTSPELLVFMKEVYEYVSKLV
ncbi:MAG: hypothetical protein J5920_02785 [Candidatus Methanomethylophilaceae archaeon]|nr:hypothetical protein [Candidatus Methanomethylophilaceae archaeon]